MAKKIVEDFLALLKDQPQILEQLRQDERTRGQPEESQEAGGQQQPEESQEAGAQQQPEESQEAGAQQSGGKPGKDRHGFYAEDYLSTSKKFTAAKSRFRVTLIISNCV